MDINGIQSKLLAPLKIQERALTDVEKVTKVLQPGQKRNTILSNKPITKVNQNKLLSKVKPLTG